MNAYAASTIGSAFSGADNANSSQLPPGVLAWFGRILQELVGNSNIRISSFKSSKNGTSRKRKDDEKRVT